MTEHKPKTEADDAELNERLHSDKKAEPGKKKTVPDGDAIADVGDAIGGPA